MSRRIWLGLIFLIIFPGMWIGLVGLGVHVSHYTFWELAFSQNGIYAGIILLLIALIFLAVAAQHTKPENKPKPEDVTTGWFVLTAIFLFLGIGICTASLLILRPIVLGLGVAVVVLLLSGCLMKATITRGQAALEAKSK